MNPHSIAKLTVQFTESEYAISAARIGSIAYLPHHYLSTSVDMAAKILEPRISQKIAGTTQSHNSRITQFLGECLFIGSFMHGKDPSP